MKRLQASVTRCATTEQLFTTVECILNQVCALWEIKEVVVLRSEPNGPVQDIHRDMSIADVADAFRATGSIPVGAIVALMPGTQLRVYNGCFGDTDPVEQGRKRDVDIPVGECLVFRGDLAHCGLSYATTNYRIHFAVGIADTTWVANQTHPVQIKTFDCKCGSCFNTNSALRRHLRWCRQFGDPEEVKATRQRYDKLDRVAEQVQCSLCPKSYSKRSSLRNHIRQSHKTATQTATQDTTPRKTSFEC